MMGRSHAALGAAAILGVGLVLPHPTAASVLSGLVVGVGGSLLPDLDEDGSTVSRVGGPATRLVGWATGKLAGGHRHATHSLLGAAVFGLAAMLLAHFRLAEGLICFAFALLTIRALIPRVLRWSTIATWALAAGAGSLAAASLSPERFGLLVGLGCLIHLVGDMATAGGVPLLWPLPRKIALPVLGHTNSVREHVAALGLLGLAVFFGDLTLHRLVLSHYTDPGLLASAIHPLHSFASWVATTVQAHR